MRLDLRHLFRNLRRSPASAIAVIVTLSLTLGAGASIFAVVDAVLLTPPPFANPETLVLLGEVPIDNPTGAPRAATYRTFEAWRARAGSQAAIEASDGANLTLTELGAAERVSGANVTPGFLPLLGVIPVLGRSFTPEDVAQRVVVVSHTFWRGRLASDPGAIGRQIVLGGEPHTIVGVLPERLNRSLDWSDFRRPFPVTPPQAVAAGYRVFGLARLGPGMSAADLEAALADVSRLSSPPSRAVATPIAEAVTRNAGGMLGVLAGAGALALLIAFTNLAGLLIVRSIDRRRELAVRSALGARRVEIARQLLLEAAALVIAGTAGGVLLALWLTPVVARLALEQFGGLGGRNISVSWRVIGAVSFLALAAASLCAALPAVLAARRNDLEILRRGTTPPPRERALRRVFVAGEVALAFVLLVAMTLLGRSLFQLLEVNPGFDADGVLSLKVSLPSARYDNGRVVTFYATLQSALEDRLGTGSISTVDEAPLTGDRGRRVVSLQPEAAGPDAVVRAVTPAYFDVMRMPILAGRSFGRGDNPSAPLRVVVSESLARRLSPSGQPIGRQVWLAAPSAPAEIIGVVGDVKHRTLDEPTLPTVYVAAAQFPSNGTIIVVRSPRPDADVIAAVRGEVARLDPDLPVYGIERLRETIARSPGVPARRVLTAAFAGFGLLAVVLGWLGLFGVAAHDVASRRAELALRIALGADPHHIMNAALLQGGMLVGAGLATGAVLALWTARTLGAALPGTGHLDLVAIGIPAVVLLLAGAAATFPAARRAARTDPLIALRAE